MLDRVDASADGPLRADGPVRVSGDFLAQRVRFIDESVQLGLGQLRGVHLIRQREHPAGGVDFDQISAVLDVSSNRGTGRVRAIDDRVRALVGQQAPAYVGGIAMPAGGADRMSGHQHSRTNDLPLADRVPQANVDELVSADVADGGKAGEQRSARAPDAGERPLRNRELEVVDAILLPVYGLLHGQMRMRIEETGQQGSVSKIEHLRPRRNRRPWSSGSNFPVTHHHQARRHHLVRLTVEHSGGFEYHRGLLGRGYGLKGQQEGKIQVAHLESPLGLQPGRAGGAS